MNMIDVSLSAAVRGTTLTCKMEVQSTVEGGLLDAGKAGAGAGDNEYSGAGWSGAWSGRSNK